MAEEETGEQKLKRQIAETKAIERHTAALIANRKAHEDRTDVIEQENEAKRASGSISEETYNNMKDEIDLRKQLAQISDANLAAFLASTEAQRQDLQARLDRIEALKEEIDLFFLIEEKKVGFFVR